MNVIAQTVTVFLLVTLNTGANEIDFISFINESPETSKEIGLQKLSDEERKNLNLLFNRVYMMGVDVVAQRPENMSTKKSKQVFSSLGMQKVEYLTDSIAEKEGKYIRLLGGSEWVLSSVSLALVTDDIIIVFKEVIRKDKTKSKLAVAYVDGDEIVANYVGGKYIPQSGYITTVVEVLGDGAILKLTDGSLLSIPQYDQYDTGWWLPPYKALLTANKMYLWNLKKVKRVWINSR